MESWLLAHSSSLYEVTMVVAFIAIAVWETLFPRYKPVIPTSKRWLTNAVLVVVGWVSTWLLFPAGALSIAVSVAGSRYGFLNREGLPLVWRYVFAFLLLDLAQYFQHYLLHRVPLLWRLHRLHHADAEYDLTTGVRFHPLESFYTRGITLLVIAVLAPPIAAVVFFELVNAVQNFFGHANASMPAGLDRLLRLVQVTPEFHRVHHSVDVSDQNTNFGSVFTFWDRLFGTLRNEPRMGEERLRFGIEQVRGEESIRILHMLALPFRHEPAPTPITESAVPQAVRGTVR